MKNSKIFLSFLFSLLLIGCGVPKFKGKMTYSKFGASMPDLIAILPPENQSNDITAVEVVQRAGGMLMAMRGYYALSNKAQDQSLRELGISDGGHLSAFSAEEISRGLGVDGLLYTVIEDFSDLNIGFFRSRKVTMKFKLTDGKGETLWEGEGKYRMKKVHVDPTAAGQQLVGGLVGNTVSKMLDLHLVSETQEAAIKLSEKVTPWPDAVTQPR